MKQSAQVEFDRLERELQRTFDDLFETADPERRSKLEKAQRAWREFRDAEAALKADMEREGTASPLIELSTKVALTRERVQQLNDYR